MISIANNFTQVRSEIANACQRANRPIDAVQLLAVSKTRTAAQLLELHSSGQNHFAENYLQEALDKITALSELPLIWHFIGPIQSNKTRAIAENFSWVHSVDRIKIARRLAEQRPQHLPPLNICIQVNISAEANKAGCSIEQTADLIEQITQLPNLKLRGLMAIPKATQITAEQQRAFAALAELLSQCQQQYPALDTLSMGMSADIVPAIEQGATIVRVGTALFGPRNYPNSSV
ncbi:MAG: YggS family pyridoxal phosphate-dependent enzyme [Pseudomonadales bacterium]|nr:YggS family pyridoxal phosphate-dependent enzyme [Pseudomonadales bacterium]NRA15685.1 YggS family pyridoxal phosphate-dependent enzyme [Oceanospirillaceae bacterium]